MLGAIKCHTCMRLASATPVTISCPSMAGINASRLGGNTLFRCSEFDRLESVGERVLARRGCIGWS